jgi:hypothetical protein
MYEARRYEMYRTRDWRSLAEQVQAEMDPEKLMNLISKLTACWRGTVTASIASLMKIESLMKIDQLNGPQIRTYAACVTQVIDRERTDRNLTDRNFDALRAHVRERSVWAVRTQRMQEITVTVMALVLGSIMGWALMR